MLVLNIFLILQLMDNTIKTVNLNKVFYVKVYGMKPPKLAVALPSNEKNTEE